MADAGEDCEVVFDARTPQNEPRAKAGNEDSGTCSPGSHQGELLTSTPLSREERSKRARRPPGPAGYAHDLHLPDEIDPHVREARKILQSPGWRAMKGELHLSEDDPFCNLSKWTVKRASTKDTNNIIKISPYLYVIVAKIDKRTANPWLIIADHTGSMEANISEHVMSDHGDLIGPGTILVLRDVVVKVSWEFNMALIGSETLVSIYAKKEQGYRAKFVNPHQSKRETPEGHPANMKGTVTKIEEGAEAGANDEDEDAGPSTSCKRRRLQK